MRLGVYSVSLPDLAPGEAVVALRESGYAGVEWRVAHRPSALMAQPPSFFGNNLCTLEPTMEAARHARRLSDDQGLEIIGLSPYIEPGDVPAVETAMTMALAAGAPQVRLRAAVTGDASYAVLFARAVDFMAAVEKLGLRYGVRAVLELHQRTICPSASLAHRLVSAFDPTAIGVVYDVGNLVIEGYEDHRIGLELLGEHLAHVHLKNAAYERPDGGGVWRSCWTPLEDGVLDVPAFLRLLEQVGYSRWVATEDFSTVRTSRETLVHNAEFLAKCCPGTQSGAQDA